MASLFLILISSILRCKREKDRIHVLPEALEHVITEGDNIRFNIEVLGAPFMNSRQFELDYTVESVLRNQKKKKTMRFVWGKQEGSAVLSAKMKICDDYVIRFTEIRWKDVTGIYTEKKDLQKEINFLVMPKRFSMEVMSQKFTSQRLLEQGFEYDGIREYREGDKLSRIHWKLYAGKGDLLVRKEEEDSDPTEICIEVKTWKEKQFSNYFAAFYSISGFLLDEGIPQKIYFGKSSFDLNHMEQYEELFTKIFLEDLQYPVSKEHEKALKIDIGDGKQTMEDYLYDMEI